MTAVAMGLGVLLASFYAWAALGAYGEVVFASGTGRVGSALFEFLTWLFWISPGIASLVVAWKTPRTKVFLGMLMAPCGAMMVAVMNLLGESGDFHGIKGTVALFAIFFVMNAVVCAVGTGAGVLLAKRSARALRQNVTS